LTIFWVVEYFSFYSRLKDLECLKITVRSCDQVWIIPFGVPIIAEAGCPQGLLDPEGGDDQEEKQGEHSRLLALLGRQVEPGRKRHGRVRAAPLRSEPAAQI